MKTLKEVIRENTGKKLLIGGAILITSAMMITGCGNKTTADPTTTEENAEQSQMEGGEKSLASEGIDPSNFADGEISAQDKVLLAEKWLVDIKMNFAERNSQFVSLEFIGDHPDNNSLCMAIVQIIDENGEEISATGTLDWKTLAEKYGVQ